MRGRTFGANQRYGGVDEVGGTEHNLSNIESATDCAPSEDDSRKRTG